MTNDLYKIQVMIEEFERVAVGFGGDYRFAHEVVAAREKLMEVIKAALSSCDE